MGGVDVLRRLGAITAELAMGSVCAGCESEPGLICAACRDQLHGAALSVRALETEPSLLRVAATAGYEGVIREIILAHKERSRLGLARPLGEALAVSVATLLETAATDAHVNRALAGGSARMSDGDSRIVLVPVPSTREAVRARGHDAVARMSRYAARLLRRAGTDATVTSALRHDRAVADQSGLSSTQRAENLAGALAVRRATERMLAGRAVVVVDDIMTTGATLREAVRVLRESGHEPLGAAVVAAA